MVAQAPPQPVVDAVAVPYAGIATRAVALAVDVAIAQIGVFAGGAVLALVGSLVADIHFDTAAGAIAAAVWTIVVAAYFVLFWSTTGQTPGMRLMSLRVVDAHGLHPGFGRSVVRVIGLGLAIIPLFAGFLPVLVDDRRRALQDFLAGTVVLYGSPDEGGSVSGPGAGGVDGRVRRELGSPERGEPGDARHT